VFGGGSLAAQKARLLSLRSAVIEIAAERLSEQFSELLAAGKIRRIDDDVSIGAIRGRPLVIAATGVDKLDTRISAIARSLGVPVNVPDKPELCTFILPAIVDRGMVTVAISTEGASPVLAQRLRGWLEREMHPRLGRLASIAGEFRERVADVMPLGHQRRRLWENVFAGPAARAVYAGDEVSARKAIALAIENAGEGDAVLEDLPARMVVVDAGAGDPELLVMRALRALKSADVIIYDRLVAAEVLGLARREVELIPVGGDSDRERAAARSAQELMIMAAKAKAKMGLAVVRLIVGDALARQRMHEEIAFARSAGFEIEVIPSVIAPGNEVGIELEGGRFNHSRNSSSNGFLSADFPKMDTVGNSDLLSNNAKELAHA